MECNDNNATIGYPKIQRRVTDNDRRNNHDKGAGFAEVGERIEAWRRTERAASSHARRAVGSRGRLAKKYSLHKVSKAFRLSYTSLKKRVHPDMPSARKEPGPVFIELDMGPTARIPECTVEMEDGSGAKMRMRFSGKVDCNLLELGKAFWRKEA